MAAGPEGGGGSRTGTNTHPLQCVSAGRREAAPPGQKLGWASSCSPVPGGAPQRGGTAVQWPRRGALGLCALPGAEERVRSDVRDGFGPFRRPDPGQGWRKGEKPFGNAVAVGLPPARPGPGRVSQGGGEKHPQHPAAG